MAEELRLALILLGSLAIGAVILHGIWTVRKTVNEERAQNQSREKNEPVVESEQEEQDEAVDLKQMEMDFNSLQQSKEEGEGLPVANVDMDSIYKVEADSGSKPVATNTVAQVEKEADADAFSNLDIVNEAMDVNDEALPDIGNLSALDHDEFDNVDMSLDPQESEPEPNKGVSEQQEVLMLFIDKEQDTPIEGAKLLPLLLTLGFKFGELNFFHRHQDSSGKGEVLFSLANMYNPGTFDIDNMEQMSTRGLTIFMTLPNAAEPLQTFNMMHNAAKKIADEFGARVLDQNRQPIDVAIVRGYVERIRKFPS